MTILSVLAAAAPDWTPEWTLDRGKAWIETLTQLVNMLLANLGIIAAAAFTLASLIKSKDAELRAKIDAVEARQNRQGEKIDTNAKTIAAVAATAPDVQQVEVVNPTTKPVPTTETKTP